jgi:hypothetical protein
VSERHLSSASGDTKSPAIRGVPNIAAFAPFVQKMRRSVMRMVFAVGVLCAALLLAVTAAVQAAAL